MGFFFVCFIGFRCSAADEDNTQETYSKLVNAPDLSFWQKRLNNLPFLFTKYNFWHIIVRVKWIL